MIIIQISKYLFPEKGKQKSIFYVMQLVVHINPLFLYY